MPRQTPRMLWPFPQDGDDPFFEFFRQTMDNLDSSGFADAENNNLIAFGGAVFTWDATSGVLAWDDDFFLSGFTTGFRVKIEGPSSLTVQDGQIIGFTYPRLITTEATVVPFVASRIAESDGIKIHDRIVIGARIGTAFYFRNGVTLEDGAFGEVWERPPTGGGGVGLTPAQKAAVNSALHEHQEFYFNPGIGIDTFTLTDPSPEVYRKFSVFRNGMRSSVNNTGLLGHTETLTTPFQVVLNVATQTADEVIIIDAEISVTVP